MTVGVCVTWASTRNWCSLELFQFLRIIEKVFAWRPLVWRCHQPCLRPCVQGTQICDLITQRLPSNCGVDLGFCMKSPKNIWGPKLFYTRNLGWQEFDCEWQVTDFASVPIVFITSQFVWLMIKFNTYMFPFYFSAWILSPIK